MNNTTEIPEDDFTYCYDDLARPVKTVKIVKISDLSEKTWYQGSCGRITITISHIAERDELARFRKELDITRAKIKKLTKKQEKQIDLYKEKWLGCV